MTIRTDIHRPSVINPAEYDFVAFDYIGPGENMGWQFLAEERRAFRCHQARTGGTFSGHDHGGTCAVCGAAAFYVARFHHRDTNRYITTGEDCAYKLDMGDAVAFRSFRDRVAAGRVAFAGRAKAQGILADNGLEAAWAVYTSIEPQKYEEGIITDIVGKLVRYGSVSDKQLSFVRSLLDKIVRRAELEADRAAQYEAAAPLPVFTGRVTLVGTVLAIKEPSEDDTSRFPATKLLIQHADGWKVWGTRPAALDGVQKGDVVEMVCTISKSDRDGKFGFYSRPSKAKVMGA